MAEDVRLERAHSFITSIGPAEAAVMDEEDYEAYECIKGLVAYAEERLRVNVGLVRDNADLRAKQRQPETIDLSVVATTDLLRELEKRCSA